MNFAANSYPEFLQQYKPTIYRNYEAVHAINNAASVSNSRKKVYVTSVTIGYCNTVKLLIILT